METFQSDLKKWVIWTFLFLSFIGFLDALYLTVKGIFGSPITCYIFEGCRNVTDSPYAKIFGIPLSFFGAAFYLLLFIFSIRYLETKNIKILKLLFYLAIFGFLFALYLLILQFFVIKALCIYCLISSFISISLFIISALSAFAENHRRKPVDK